MRFKVHVNKREVMASGLLCLLGMAAVLQVSANSVARVSGMGAGFLPGVLGAMLMFFGVLWLFDSRLSPDEDEDCDLAKSKWRGSCGLVSGVFAFLLIIKYGGLIPALFALVFISAMGDLKHSWRSALFLSLLVAGAASLLVFWPGWPAMTSP